MMATSILCVRQHVMFMQIRANLAWESLPKWLGFTDAESPGGLTKHHPDHDGFSTTFL